MSYRSNKADQQPKESSEKSRALAETARQLLNEWKTPPGTQPDGTFSAPHFTQWLQYVKRSCTQSGHIEVALRNIGNVLIHTPADPDGLWIHRAVAAALNTRDADDMRASFTTKIYNSRGFHSPDPTGKPEKELAEQWREKAEKTENASFHRVAAILRELAEKYERKSELIIDAHQAQVEE